METHLIQVRDTEGTYHNVHNHEVIAAAKRCISTSLAGGDLINTPNLSRDYFQVLLGEREHEVFAAMWLDTRHRVLKVQELFRGTIDGTSVHCREVVKEGLACNAAAVIFGHNHPSGVADPSQADIKITKALKESLALIGIRVLDHVVVGATTVSLAERGDL